MHPLNKKHFGPASTSLSIRYWNGTAIVNGYVIRQLGETRYLVTDGLNIRKVYLATTTQLAQYCNGTAVPGGDYSIIDGLATIVATRAGTHFIRKITSKIAYTTEGLYDRWAINSAPNGEFLLGGVATLVLRDLSTSSINFPVNTDFSVYVRNITPGSSVAVTSEDGTIIAFSPQSRHISGRFTQVGTPLLTFVETLAGATGSPRTSTYEVNVNATDDLAALTISPNTATEDRAFFGAVMGKTAGSTVTATSSDDTALTVYGGMVTGTFSTTGVKTLTLTESLLGDNRVSVVTVTVS